MIFFLNKKKKPKVFVWNWLTPFNLIKKLVRNYKDLLFVSL